MTAVDTSVLVAAFASWHESHAQALDACDSDPVLPAHAYVEAYSSLTRLPEPFRIAAPVVAEYLRRRWADKIVLPTDELVARLPQTMESAGLAGGATYDGLIALTAQETGQTLLSLDRRAQRTYRLLGVSHQLLAV